MEEQVRKALLASGYLAAEIQLEETRNGNVGGFVVSPSFAGVSQLERQERLWEQLRGRLDADALHHIVSILTMTPAEVEDDVRTPAVG